MWCEPAIRSTGVSRAEPIRRVAYSPYRVITHGEVKMMYGLRCDSVYVVRIGSGALRSTSNYICTYVCHLATLLMMIV